MNDFLFSLGIIFPLFVMILLGYFLKAIGLFNDGFLKIGNAFAFKVLLPMLLFVSIAKSDFVTDFNWKLVVFVLVGVLLIFLLTTIIVPVFVKDKKRIPVIIQGIFRNNFILFGVPICQSIYGDHGAAMAAMMAAFLIPLLNVLSVIILSAYNDSHKHSVKQTALSIAKNPLIIACLFGIASSLGRVQIPTLIMMPLESLSVMATPFALIMLGGSLKFASIKKNIKPIAIVTVLKVIVAPLIMLTIGYFLGMRNVEFAVLIATFASPVAISSQIMAQQENADSALAGEFIASTAFVATFTIFLFVYFCRLLGLLIT